MGNDFYARGQSDCLRKLPANPTGAGTANPREYNEYMNGYNSVNSTQYKKTLSKTVDLPRKSNGGQTEDGRPALLKLLDNIY